MSEVRHSDLEQPLLSLGLFFLNVIFFPLLAATLLFMVGISVSPLHFPIAVIAAAAVSFLPRKQSWRRAALTALIGLAILAFCILLSGYVEDWSWDGNSYHKGITGALCWGWNPLRESFFQFAEPFPFLEHCTATWYDAYPKASELFAACIHSFTRNIEAGKAFNLLSIAALFFLSWGMLTHSGLLKHWQSVICAGLLVLTPVSTSQIFTYYNDGFLANVLLLCLIGLLYFTLYPQGSLRPLAGYGIFVSINLGFNIKFSATLFFAILCLTFFGCWVVRDFRGRSFAQGVRAVRGRFLLLAASVISGVLLLGSTSYVTNTIRYHNPFYTMIGPGSTEIITSQLPYVFRPMNHLTRFVASLFSRTNTSLEMPAVEWKLPFTFTFGEFYNSAACDVRTAGWGVLFSGIFLISIAVIIWSLRKCRRSRPEVFRLTLVLSVMLAVSVLFIPGLCWARYFTALFYVPVAALLFLFVWWNREKGRGKLICAVLITALLCFDMAPNAGCALILLKDAHLTWEQLDRLKACTETGEVVLGYGPPSDFEGRMFGIRDAGITDFTFGEIDPEDYTDTVYQRYRLYYKVIQEEN